MAIARSRRWAVGTASASAVLAAALVIPVAAESDGAAARAAASTVLANFTTQGWSTWTVPTGRTTVTLTVFGASGNVNVSGNILNSVGGLGGEARGQFAVRAGEVFEVYAGSGRPRRFQRRG